MKTVYLLGAGASYDAGLPMSLGLTDKIGELISEKEAIEPCPFAYEPEVGLMTQAYYAIRALLQAGDVYAGRPPTIGVDIERIFSAAQALATLDDNDLTPFVQQWREPFQMPPDLREWKYFIEFVQECSPATQDHRGFGSVLESSSRLQQVYMRLCTEICETLPKALTATSPNKHQYLLPLLRGGEVSRIATLNYDLGVENAASLLGLTVDTGVTNWRGGMRWQWGENQHSVQLLKLHGSLDWGRLYGDGDYLPPGAPRIATEALDENCYLEYTPRAYETQPPGLIFGVRNKLRPDGPFMAMLHELWRWLEDAERLVVVGYSFRDEHINTLIQDWIELYSGRTLEVVDPSTPESWSRCSYSTSSFVRCALDFVRHEAPGCPAHPRAWYETKPRFIFHRQGAADWLRSGAAGL